MGPSGLDGHERGTPERGQVAHRHQILLALALHGVQVGQQLPQALPVDARQRADLRRATKKRKRKKRDMVSVITTRPPWNRERRRRPHQPLVELQLLVAFQRQTGDPLRVELVRQQRLRQRPEEAFQAVLASETKRTTKQFLIGRRSTMDQSGALTVTSCSE